MTYVRENEGIQAREAATCFLCRKPGALLYSNLRDRLFSAAGVWSLRRCPEGHLVWLDPAPLSAEVKKLYEDYLTHAQATPPSRRRLALREAIKQGVLARAFGYPGGGEGGWGQRLGRFMAGLGILRDTAGGGVLWLPANRRGKLLDVGCGNGQFLARMRELGWEVAGVEPDPAAVQPARASFGLNIVCGTLEQAGFASGSFDAITLHHVIEHLPDPVATLRDCARLLASDGVLVVATPNIKSLGHSWFGQAWLGLDPPRHLLLFSPAGLRACAEQAGLRIQELRTSARLAAFTFHASSLLRRDGRLPGGSPPRLSGPRWWAGYLFWLLEHFFAKLFPCGEEIVLLAARAERPKENAGAVR